MITGMNIPVCISNLLLPIRERLTESGYHYDITARTKSVYSVWSKMQRRHISFEEIYDLLAVRIVFDPKDNQPEKWQCWNIYSLITDMYSPKTGENPGLGECSEG